MGCLVGWGGFFCDYRVLLNFLLCWGWGWGWGWAVTIDYIDVLIQSMQDVKSQLLSARYPVVVSNDDINMFAKYRESANKILNPLGMDLETSLLEADCQMISFSKSRKNLLAEITLGNSVIKQEIIVTGRMREVARRASLLVSVGYDKLKKIYGLDVPTVGELDFKIKKV